MVWAIGVAAVGITTGIDLQPMRVKKLARARDAVRYWTLVASGYVLMNLGEDASVVAFMFC